MLYTAHSRAWTNGEPVNRKTLANPLPREAAPVTRPADHKLLSRTIADWLVWRREVAPVQQTFLANIRARIEQARQEAARKGAGLSKDIESAKPNDVIVNVNEQELAREIEGLEDVLSTLDGQLSLRNATLMIDA